MAKIPQFNTLEEAAEFWATHDFEDYIDETEAAEFWATHDFEDYIDETESVNIKINIPRRKKILTVFLDAKVYQQIETLATKQGLRTEEMMSSWLKEKAMEESAAG